MIRSVMYTRSSSQLLSMAAVRLMLLGKGGDHCQDTAWGGDTGTLPHPARQAGTHGTQLPAAFPLLPVLLGCLRDPGWGWWVISPVSSSLGASPRYSTSGEAGVGGRELQAEQRWSSEGESEASTWMFCSVTAHSWGILWHPKEAGRKSKLLP